MHLHYVPACFLGSVRVLYPPNLRDCATCALTINFLCRVNISNAAILGLQEDLHITKGTKYNTALVIFFVPYIIFEIPSNILLKKFKPHVWCTLNTFNSLKEELAN